MGSFTGVGDQIHDVQGIAKLIPIENGSDVLSGGFGSY
jgi:hypothetical protein